MKEKRREGKGGRVLVHNYENFKKFWNKPSKSEKQQHNVAGVETTTVGRLQRAKKRETPTVFGACYGKVAF